MWDGRHKKDKKEGCESREKRKRTRKEGKGTREITTFALKNA